MTREKTPQIGITAIGAKSEWFVIHPAYECLFNQEIQKLFNFDLLVGRTENTTDEMIVALNNVSKTAIGKCRPEIRERQRRSAEALAELLSNGSLTYSQGLDGTIPPQDAPGAMFVYSANPFHMEYIEKGLKRGFHVFCEKPLVCVLDEKGKPTREQIDRLERVLQQKYLPVLMDAEHYSYKPATRLFYRVAEELLRGERVSHIDGELLEIDDPDHPRTKKTLNAAHNQTGTGLDVIPHLMYLVDWLGGRVEPVHRVYDCFPGYDIDTYDDAMFLVHGTREAKERFCDNATVRLRVGKFIDKMIGLEKPSKRLRIDCESGRSITVDFANDSVVKIDENGREINRFVENSWPGEYAFSMKSFYEAIVNGTPLITDPQRSLRVLKAIYKMYALPLSLNTRHRMYRVGREVYDESGFSSGAGAIDA